MMNVLNGGAHAANNIDLQEFMVVPVGAASFREACNGGPRPITTCAACWWSGGCRPASATRGLCPDLDSNEAAVAVLVDAIEAAGLTLAMTWLSPWMWPRLSSSPMASTA